MRDKEKMPPAGGEVEVLAIFKADGSSLHHTRAGFNRPLTGADIELVDRAHITRLQAELDAERQEVASYKYTAQKLLAERDGLQALYDDTQTRLIESMKDAKALETERYALQSELTKARELFTDLVSSPDAVMVPLHLWRRVQTFVHQSAPAAKDGNDE